MKKLLNTRDILLLGLSGALDLFEEIKDPLSIFSKSYETMYGWVPKKYKRHNFNHLVWRNIRTGYIEKIEKNGEVYIRLTPQGSQRMVRDFPLLSLQKRKWDKKWRIAIFDIEEINRRLRDNLRFRLKELGFGMLQKSVFISPHDILRDFSEFINYLGLDKAVYVLETSTFTIGDTKELANKVWNLNFFNERYKQVVEKGREIQKSHLTKPHDRSKMLNSRDEEQKRKLRSQYLEIIVKDPFLPKEMLPFDWFGYEAKKLIKNL